MRVLSKLLLLVLLVMPSLAMAQSEIIRQNNTNKFALTNAKIYTVTNGVIENGTIVISNGIIEAVSANVDIPTDAMIIDYEGGEIYPGMIDAGTQLGIKEIGSIAEAQDVREFGDITPQMDALTAVNPNSVSIPVTRVSGVTTVITMPDGGVLPGMASTINLFGYNADQMYAGSKGLVINFPNSARRWRQTQEQADKAREKALKELNDAWDKAELYNTIKDQPGARYYPEMDAICKAINGDVLIYIEVNAAKDIQSAIEWVGDRELDNVVFVGVSEGFRVADEIAAAGIPVIAGPTIELPTRTSDRYDVQYKNPGIMQQAGVKVALRTADAENSRNLPFHAGFAAAFGMGREEALKAITINAAEIMGLEDQIGSIEVGKKANLFISTGDPFEPASQILDVFIDGYQVPMTSRQTELYDEFLHRNPGLEKNPATDNQ